MKRFSVVDHKFGTTVGGAVENRDGSIEVHLTSLPIDGHIRLVPALQGKPMPPAPVRPVRVSSPPIAKMATGTENPIRSGRLPGFTTKEPTALERNLARVVEPQRVAVTCQICGREVHDLATHLEKEHDASEQ